MDHIFSKHKHWIKVVEKFGEKNYAEDVVQEAYIKVMKLDKEINEAYFYYTLRSITMRLHTHKVIKIEISQDMEYRLADEVYEDNTAEILAPYLDLINTWPEYDKLMYLCWVKSDLSIRKFAKDLGISFMSVYHTLNNCKKRIKLWQQEKEQN